MSGRTPTSFGGNYNDYETEKRDERYNYEDGEYDGEREDSDGETDTRYEITELNQLRIRHTMF